MLVIKNTNNGGVTTVAGKYPGYKDGHGYEIQFNTPKNLNIIDANSLYIVHSGNNNIRKLTINPNTPIIT